MVMVIRMKNNNIQRLQKMAGVSRKTKYNNLMYITKAKELLPTVRAESSKE